MTTDDHPLYASVNRKLAEIIAASPVRLPWQQAWQQLEAAATPRQRLPLYRAIRDSGCLPAEAGFFLVAWLVDFICDEHAEHALREPEARLEAIRQKYGLEEETPGTEHAPPEYRRAMREVHEAWDRLYAATLDELGETDLAQLFREDRQQFDREYEAGQRYFHGDVDDCDEDGWLDELLDAVAACMEAESPMGPLGLRYFDDAGIWEIVVHPSPVELVGGRHDGEVLEPGFLVDLEMLRAAFEEVKDFGWNPLGLNDPDGPYISVEGLFEGKEVFLRLLAHAPEDAEPGIKVDASGRWRARHDREDE
ncbi:MAG: hypothetical protein AB7K24_09145 [Gemmataceae bacterium]